MTTVEVEEAVHSAGEPVAFPAASEGVECSRHRLLVVAMCLAALAEPIRCFRPTHRQARYRVQVVAVTLPVEAEDSLRENAVRELFREVITRGCQVEEAVDPRT